MVIVAPRPVEGVPAPIAAQPPGPAGRTLSALFQDVQQLLFENVRERHRKARRNHIVHWVTIIGDRPAAEIDEQTFQTFRTESLDAGYSVATIDRVTATIRSVLSLAGHKIRYDVPCHPAMPKAGRRPYISQAVVWLLSGEEGLAPIWRGRVAITSRSLTLSIAVAMLHELPAEQLVKVNGIVISHAGRPAYDVAGREMKTLRSLWKAALADHSQFGEIGNDSCITADGVQIRKTDGNTTLFEFLDQEFLAERVNVSAAQALNYRIAIRLLNKFQGRQVKLAELSEKMIVGLMRHLRIEGGHTDRTINNKRCLLLTLWKAGGAAGYCRKPEKVQKLNEPKRAVRAWDIDDVARILEACDSAPKIQGWDGRHWRALILTMYDTSHRLGALLKTQRSALGTDGLLTVPAEICKHREDTVQRLHPETIAAITALPKSNKLFAWPHRPAAIFARFKEILRAAELPFSRRDMFHKIRRTSYTYVYAKLGPQAAGEHAAHHTDMSRHYLDVQLMRTLQGLPATMDSLPRPQSRTATKGVKHAK